MKYIFTICIALLALQLQAQTQNADFELWEVNQNSFNVSGTFSGFPFTIDEPLFSYDEIVDWSSTNQLTVAQSFSNTALVTKHVPPFSGDTAVRLESKALSITAMVAGQPISFDNVAPALVVSGNIDIDVQSLVDDILAGGNLNALNPFTFPNTGQAINFRPGSISGHYQYSGANGDSCLIVSGAIRNREIVAFTMNRLGNTAANTWTPFSFEFDYVNCELPDTIITLICASNLELKYTNGDFTISSNYTGEDGSVMLVDAFELDTIDISSFPPLAIDDNSAILNIEVATLDVVANDEFCDGSDPDPTVLTGPTNGTVVLLGTGELEYTPDLGFDGMETITYEVCNSGNVCDTATWTITVSPVDPCIADDITVSMNVNSVELIDVSNTNCGGTPIIIGGASNGASNVEANNQISYSPNTGYAGADTINYTICSINNAAQCDTGMIFINVITAIQELDKALYAVYPNPVNDVLSIVMNNSLSGQFQLINLNGQLVKTSTLEGNTSVSLAALANGTYFLRIITERGTAIEKIQISK